jgi:hypothetical protein
MAEFLNDKTRGPSLVVDCSKELDVAALGQKLTPVAIDHGHIINTDYIYLGQEQFRKLFYSVDGEHFQVNDTVCKNPCVSDEVECLYKKTLFNNKFIVDNKSYIPLNLIEHILEKYETDLGTPRNCWEACSVIDLENTLSCVRSLCDVGGGCEVLCALTWSELCQLIQTRRYSKCYGENELGPDCAVREILVISAIFKSANSEVKDCTVKFRFAVDWCCDPFYNPWLTHFVNPQSAVGAMFFSTQQSKDDGAEQVKPLPFNRLPPCTKAVLEKINNTYDNPLPITALWYGTIPVDCVTGDALDHKSIPKSKFDRRVKISATNFITYVKDPLFGYPEGDPLKQANLVAGITDTPTTDMLEPADTPVGNANAGDYLAGLTQGVAWTTNPCGGNPNAGTDCGKAVNGVWPQSWPIGIGEYDISSPYAAGEFVNNWFWPDWCKYQININFNREWLAYAYQPLKTIGNPKNCDYEPLYTKGSCKQFAKNFMVPISFKFLPWIKANCTVASLKYWCDYKLIDKTPSPVDLYIEKGIASNNWNTVEDCVVLPVFNDSSKHPRLELLVPSECDSGLGETVTTYVFEFCISEVPNECPDCECPEPEPEPEPEP